MKILDTIDCADYEVNSLDLYNRIKSNYKKVFNADECIVVILNEDYYCNDNDVGLKLQNIQTILNEVDISNFFIHLHTSNKQINDEYDWILVNVSQDPVPINITIIPGDFKKYKNLDNNKLSKIMFQQLDNDKLSRNTKHFCSAPWVHLMVETTGDVKLCCSSSRVLGNIKESSLNDIWNTLDPIRNDMVADEKIKGCERCYNEEKLHKFSQRNSINAKFSKYVKIGETVPFKLRYWDYRFNNLCNLSCRSCNPSASTSWYKISQETGINKSTLDALLNSNQTASVYNQLLEHTDYVDEIYFAGGEPLIMEDHYQVLTKLKNKNPKLVYNTNLTKLSYKDKSIFDYWKDFNSLSIGASLDGENERAEYLRSGTIWKDIVNNRKQILNHYPDIDFWITATTSIVNALHIPDFHKSWVEQGLINPEDFNIQTLYGPAYLRIDHSPPELKNLIIKKYTEHLKWLQPIDPLGRATSGFQGVINQLLNLKPFDKKDFWHHINLLDSYHNTNLLETFPELNILPKS